MALRIALYKDTIRKTGTLVPWVVHQNNLDFEEFLSYMSKVSGFQIPNLRSVLQHFAEALADQLANGYQVRTPLGTFVTGIHLANGSTLEAEPGASPRIDPDNLSLTLRSDRGLLQTVRQKVNLQVVDRHRRPDDPYHRYPAELRQGRQRYRRLLRGPGRRPGNPGQRL